MEVDFIARQLREEAARRAQGLPLAKLADIENTVFFRFLSPEQQDEIRLAGTDREKREIFQRHILGG